MTLVAILDGKEMLTGLVVYWLAISSNTVQPAKTYRNAQFRIHIEYATSILSVVTLDVDTTS